MADHNLIVLSDVHLGSDLVHCVRPDAPARVPSSDHRDRELTRLLDWYREHPRNGRPWRLVIAGDLVDFVGMSVPPPGARTFSLLDEEDRTLGLGAAEEHAVYKLRCVARRHPGVFESLARFVGRGNTLVIVRGNHDLDFHWPSVQDEFIRQLALHVPIVRGSVEFSPWFYYEEGRVYIEHGHQYDRYCSCESLLHPVSPENPRRSSRSFSDILLRNVVRPTRGLLETGHERAGALDYIRFAVGLGTKGMISLATRFAGAVVTLFSMWRAHMGEGAKRIRREHERRMTDLAFLLGFSVERLRQLASLQRPPVTTSLHRLATTVMVDRLLLIGLAALSALLAFRLASGWHHALAIVAGIAVGFWGLSLLLARVRRDIEPSRELRDGAARIARLFPAAFVVMGHTHLPEVTRTEGSVATYVNLGAWADDGTGGTERSGESESSVATRTHLVLHQEDDGVPIAELFVWDESEGPRRFRS